MNGTDKSVSHSEFAVCACVILFIYNNLCISMCIFKFLGLDTCLYKWVCVYKKEGDYSFITQHKYTGLVFDKRHTGAESVGS